MALTIGLAPTVIRNCIWNSIYYVRAGGGGRVVFQQGGSGAAVRELILMPRAMIPWYDCT